MFQLVKIIDSSAPLALRIKVTHGVLKKWGDAVKRHSLSLIYNIYIVEIIMKYLPHIIILEYLSFQKKNT